MNRIQNKEELVKKQLLDSLKGKQFQLRFSREDHGVEEIVYIIIKKGLFGVTQLKHNLSNDNIERFCSEYHFTPFYLELIRTLTKETIDTYKTVSDNMFDNIQISVESNGGTMAWNKGCDDSILLLLQILDFVAPKQLSSLISSKNIYFSIDDVNLKYITLPDIYSFMYESNYRNTSNECMLDLSKKILDEYTIQENDFYNAKKVLGVRYRIEPTLNKSEVLLSAGFVRID